jgi:hypothetical protein
VGNTVSESLIAIKNTVSARWRCAGVAEIPKLQTVLRTTGAQRNRHRTCIVEGRFAVAETIKINLTC